MKIIFILGYGVVCFLGSVWCYGYISRKTGSEFLGGMMNFFFWFGSSTACLFLIAKPLKSDFIYICGYVVPLVVCIIVHFLNEGVLPIGKEEEPNGDLPKTYFGAVEKTVYPLKRIFGHRCEYCGRRFWRKKNLLATCHCKWRAEGKMPSGLYGTGYGKWKNRGSEIENARRRAAYNYWSNQESNGGTTYIPEVGWVPARSRSHSTSPTLTRYGDFIQGDDGTTYRKVGGRWVGSDGSSIVDGGRDLAGNEVR